MLLTDTRAKGYSGLRYCLLEQASGRDRGGEGYGNLHNADPCCSSPVICGWMMTIATEGFNRGQLIGSEHWLKACTAIHTGSHCGEWISKTQKKKKMALSCVEEVKHFISYQHNRVRWRVEARVSSAAGRDLLTWSKPRARGVTPKSCDRPANRQLYKTIAQCLQPAPGPQSGRMHSEQNTFSPSFFFFF